MTTFIRSKSFAIKRTGNVDQDCAALRAALRARDKQFEASIQQLLNPKSPSPEQSPQTPSEKWGVTLSRKRTDR